MQEKPDTPDLPEQVDDDIAGVQGGEAEAPATPVTSIPATEDTAEAPPPDAGEIEWAGTVVKKPPHPEI